MYKVLFVCIQNSARSQMAETYLKALGGDGFFVESAGLEPGELNPLAIHAMEEVGYDISNNSTNSVFDYFKEGRKYHYVIKVCDASNSEKCPIFPDIIDTLHWNLKDPSAFNGSFSERLDKTRAVRDEIRKRIIEFIYHVKSTNPK